MKDRDKMLMYDAGAYGHRIPPELEQRFVQALKQMKGAAYPSPSYPEMIFKKRFGYVTGFKVKAHGR
jgi:hypothetical protein